MDMEDRADLLMRPEFLHDEIRPALEIGRNGDRPSVGPEASIVRNKARITIQYTFGDQATAYGKVFKDDLGSHSFRVLERLWHGGFGKSGSFRVPEPIRFFHEHNAYLMGLAVGAPMTDIVGRDDPEALARVRLAARWLVGLHRSAVRVGRPQSMWESAKLYDLMKRMTKTAVEVPDRRRHLIKMIQKLCHTADNNIREVPQAQTHGRFVFDNVFIDGDTVTAIDLDGSVPADPSKDVAEFLHVLRIRSYKKTEDMTAADAASRAFLDEYRSHLPRNLAHLPAHWGSFTLEKLTKFAGKERKYVDQQEYDYDSFAKRMEFFENEIDAILSNRFLN